MKKIEIHYDFHIGNEISYYEGTKTKDSFQTHALDFFCYDTLTPDRDVVIVRSDGAYISAQEIFKKTYKYSDKEIRPSHNIRKLFISGYFNWRKPRVLWNQEGYSSPTSLVITDLDSKYQDKLWYNLDLVTVRIIEHLIYDILGNVYTSYQLSTKQCEKLVKTVTKLLDDIYLVDINEGPLMGRNVIIAPYVSKEHKSMVGKVLTITSKTSKIASWSFPLYSAFHPILLRYEYQLSKLTFKDIHHTVLPPVLKQIVDDGITFTIEESTITFKLKDKVLFYHTVET